MMVVGIITGSGMYTLPGLEQGEIISLQTPFGATEVSRGIFQSTTVLHVSRHGAGHVRLSSGVNHRANVWALNELGAEAVIACTVCGAVDPALELGSLIVFDDLHFISNRLADGSLCTFFTEPGDPERGHWILHGGPYSGELREALAAAARKARHAVLERGIYGHVDGPRFNTPTEIAQLAACGVTAVSQTGGPETVLCGELELPFALLGFVTDYANEVRPAEPTSVALLLELLAASPAVFADVLRAVLPRLHERAPAAAGAMFRLERR
jgi:purine nucleoside phosphorylase